MQTLQYTHSLQRITKELQVRELADFLRIILVPNQNRQITPQEKNHFVTLLFASRAGYTRLAEDPTIDKVMQSLRIGEIYDPPRLGELVRIMSLYPNTNNLYGSAADVVEVFKFFDLVDCLARLESSCTSLLEQEKLGKEITPDQTLDLQLIDYDGQGIDATRLEEFVRIVRQLHADFALIYGIHNDKLRFVYFDSGSDLLTKIQGALPIVTGIKTLLVEWWEYFKFRDHKEFGQDMDAVSKGLTVMGQVQDAVNNNVINEETGNLLKARVLKGVDDLIGISATLPIQQEPEMVNMRQMLIERRDSKLLTSGESTEPDKTSSEN